MASLHLQPPLLWTAGTIWPPVCAIVVAARFATRRAQRARFGFDDWLILPALAIIFGMAAALLAGVGQRALAHPTPVPIPGTELTATSPEQTVTRKVFYASVALQTAALMFIKLSCMLFYKRIFGKATNVIVTATIQIINALILLWGLGFFFSWVFGCQTHFDYFWTTVENQLKCETDLAMMQLALSISDVIMDVIILIFPIPLILRLQMSTSNKVAVLGIFLIGATAIAMSITRLVIIDKELNAQFAAHADEDFVSTAGIYFMFTEACFGLTAVCLPSLSGAFKLKGVQTMIEGFSSAFSNLSRSSVRSGGSRGTRRTTRSRENHTRLDSSHSDTPKQLVGSSRASQADTDLEMYPLPTHQGITATTEIAQTSTQRSTSKGDTA